MIQTQPKLLKRHCRQQDDRHQRMARERVIDEQRIRQQTGVEGGGFLPTREMGAQQLLGHRQPVGGLAIGLHG